MTDINSPVSSRDVLPTPFKAETRQLLNILIHSLYSDREIFLRELISNASDALMQVDFEMLTNRDVLDPESELNIKIIPNPEENTLTITDTGIGMTAQELTENLGTIAHSGARMFVEAAQEETQKLSDIIGQFGVGFYSAFMVADSISVVSKSFRKDKEASSWYSDGSDSFIVKPDVKSDRGTSVIIKLKEDAFEYLEINRLREVIKRHSDFIPFPIFLGDEQDQVNRQTALWRQQPHILQENEYTEFYKQLTLDYEPPITFAHMVVDAPVQMYALLFIPKNPERNIFSARKEDGLKLYSRKVLIQEYCRDLLPDYLGFVQGIVDSEDLPLNVSRESYQANKILANLKKLITNKVIDTLNYLAKETKEIYIDFWQAHKNAIKQGVAVEVEEPDRLYPLLRFRTTQDPDVWSSLDDYVERMKSNQKDIYYILGDDKHSILYSPHLETVKSHDYEVLLLTDPLDSFMITRLSNYNDYRLVNVASSDLELPTDDENDTSSKSKSVASEDLSDLIYKFKVVLEEKVADVRISQRLSESPARLIDTEGAPNQEMQRLYRLIDRDFVVPEKILELNPSHPIIQKLNAPQSESEVCEMVIEQVYEDALLYEGLHPDPTSMISRIQKIIEAALD